MRYKKGTEDFKKSPVPFLYFTVQNLLTIRSYFHHGFITIIFYTIIVRKNNTLNLFHNFFLRAALLPSMQSFLFIFFKVPQFLQHLLHITLLFKIFACSALDIQTFLISFHKCFVSCYAFRIRIDSASSIYSKYLLIQIVSQ